MKNRLLEDIDDSQSGPSAPAVRRPPRAAAPPPEAQAQAQPRPRAGVWRSRETLPPLRLRDDEHDPVPDDVAPPAQAAPPEPPAAPLPPPRVAAGIPPWPASFSSREPDWPIPPPDDPLPWTERWGRKALGWAVGVAGIVAVAGAATWMYRETQVQSTLAVVAGNTPGKLAASPPTPTPALAPPVTAAIPASPEPAWTPPPLKMLPPPALPEPVAQEPVAAAPPVAAPPRAAPAPKAKRAPERRVAAVPVKKKAERPVAAAPPRKARAAPDLSWAARERERMLAQAVNTRAPRRPAPPPAAPEQPAPGQPAPQAGAEAPLSETLRLCRAAGYHAAACMKRGCEATRFGLVCRG